MSKMIYVVDDEMDIRAIVRSYLEKEGYTVNEYENGEDYFGFQHLRQIRDFYNSIESDTEPFISGEEALKMHALIMKIYEMGRAGMR